MYVLCAKDAGILLLIYSKLKMEDLGNDSKMEIWTCHVLHPSPFLRPKLKPFPQEQALLLPSPSIPV